MVIGFGMGWREEEENELESSKGASLITWNHGDTAATRESVLTNSREMVEENLA